MGRLRQARHGTERDGGQRAVAGAERILRKEINAQVHTDLLANLKQELE